MLGGLTLGSGERRTAHHPAGRPPAGAGSEQIPAAAVDDRAASDGDSAAGPGEGECVAGTPNRRRSGSRAA